MNQGKDVEAGDDCVVVGNVGGGDGNVEEEEGEGDVCEAEGDGDASEGVDDDGAKGGAAGEVHLIGPGFFSRCCAHVHAVLRTVLEMRVKL